MKTFAPALLLLSAPSSSCLTRLNSHINNFVVSKLVNCSHKSTSSRLCSTGSILASSSQPKSYPTIDQHSSLFHINTMLLLFYSTLGSALPYLPVYYRSVGIPDNQIGLLGSITPAITFAVSPLWGALADSKNWHKQIMVFTFMGSVLLRTLLVYNTKNVLWFSLIVALSATLNAPVKPLMDTAVMGVLKDKSDYGRCRLFGQCGFGLGSFLSGNFLAGNVQGIFTVQCLLALPSMILMMLFSPKTSEKSTENVDISKAIYYVLKDLKTLVFFFAVLNIGIMSGIIENFCYVRLMELPNIKNTNILGTCRFIGSLCGMPMFYFSGKISKLVNVNLILTFSFLAFIARFIIYAIVTNPWYALPAEIIRGVTFAGFWAGCTQFVYNASPVGLTATMLGLLSGIYTGLGPAVGSVIGGTLSKKYGIAMTFLMCAGVYTSMLALLVIWIGFDYLSNKKENLSISNRL